MEKGKTCRGPFLCVLRVKGYFGSRLQGDGSEWTQIETQIGTSLSLLESRPKRVCRSRALRTRWKAAHHRSIRNETGTVTIPARETIPTTVGKRDVASRKFIYSKTTSKTYWRIAKDDSTIRVSSSWFYSLRSLDGFWLEIERVLLLTRWWLIT